MSDWRSSMSGTSSLLLLQLHFLGSAKAIDLSLFDKEVPLQKLKRKPYSHSQLLAEMRSIISVELEYLCQRYKIFKVDWIFSLFWRIRTGWLWQWKVYLRYSRIRGRYHFARRSWWKREAWTWQAIQPWRAPLLSKAVWMEKCLSCPLYSLFANSDGGVLVVGQYIYFNTWVRYRVAPHHYWKVKVSTPRYPQ